ncbi:hypothetical protein F7725_000546 [Dissostichus mawsoni]|uniref:Family with sequence similarity 217 member B n=1 Tax=Dissostichus mawsoni TaxID=36200 RepID=A0A7J5ZGN4_DISMA|nr:hypothetical protein F7725_000546 [Dissostichus mawsoni]
MLVLDSNNIPTGDLQHGAHHAGAHSIHDTETRVVSKEKIRVKHTENSEPVTRWASFYSDTFTIKLKVLCYFSDIRTSKQGNKMKKAVGQMKNGLPGPGQDKDTVTTLQKGTQSKGGRVKSGTTRNTTKLSSPEAEGDVKPLLRKHLSVHRKEEQRENQRMSQCSNELHQNRGGMGKNRRALSLPLSPISGLRHMPAHPLTHSPAPTPEALQRHYNQKDVDTDSASDLSDSERLPVLPSPCTPCTPPHLNLRAEVINSNDFPPDFPGPHGAMGDEDEIDKPSYSYPDFLPPPFNSWSLRQLAVFLHTDGRGAPRPKPVGSLEKYLERLLQLEWLQIQTGQAESSRVPGSRPRPQSFPSATTAHPPRPHTAPPSRLNSPKGLRQSQRSFPFTPVNNPPHLPQPSNRTPAFQFALTVISATRCAMEAARPMPTNATQGSVHCLSVKPDLEHQLKEAAVRPEQPQRKGGALEHKVEEMVPEEVVLEEMVGEEMVGEEPRPQLAPQVEGVISETCRPQAMLESGTNPNSRGQVRKSRVRANSETDVKKEPGGSKAAGAEKQVGAASKREVTTSKRVEKDWQRTEAVGQASKTAMKRAAKEPQSLSKSSASSKQNGKTKNVHFVAK